MKKALSLCSLLVVSVLSIAQTLQDARQLAYHERFNSATKATHALIQSNANDENAWQLLASIYLDNKQPAAIKDSLLQAPQALREKPLLMSVYGHILLEEKKADSAKYYFDKALKETKMKDPAVLAEIAKAHVDVKEGDANYAIELLDKAIKRDSKIPALYIILGDAYRKLSDGGQALKAYEKALDKDKDYAAANYRIGKIFTSQGNAELYLDYFNKAIASDPQYAPALYELYYHYYFKDAPKAMQYLQQYITASDVDAKNDVLLTDMLYVSKQYDAAIAKAQELITANANNVQPRLYKLIAYSYKESGKPAEAIGFMEKYFNAQADTGLLVKDFEAMAEINTALGEKEDAAASWYAKASDLEKDSTKKTAYYKTIAALYKKIKDHDNEAIWLGKYYTANPNPSNVDLFNWGISNFLSKNYVMADSVFGMYEKKYPAEEFGYYWCARAAAAIDTSMEQGLAVPHYMELVKLLSGADTTDDATLDNSKKKHLVEAYGYIAAYKANTEKDYEEAIDYFEKMLALEPNNADAKRYIDILKKTQEKNTGPK
jgi:tetratricopeptide (TPR) repeat protein